MRRHTFNSLRTFEVLEDRRMMAGDISYNSNNHILMIDGAGYNDVAEVRFEGNRVYVDLIAGESDGDTDDHDLDKRISDVSKIVFNGFAGNDTLTVFVNNLSSGVTLNNVTLEFHGGDGHDRLSQLNGGVKTLAWGGAGNDVLQGSRFDDILEGGAGDDDVSGGAGNDKYVFSGSTALGKDRILNEASNVDTDTLDFANFGELVHVDLAAASVPGAVFQPYAVMSGTYKLLVTIDNATAIENVIGTAYDDGIFGNSRPNYLEGRGGRDTLTGAGGNDTLDGGAGDDMYLFYGSNLGTDTIIEHANADRDSLNFSGMSKGVNVDLTKFGTNYAVNSTDLKLKLSNATAIENVYGSEFDDEIIGNSRDNELFGLGGNDVITGGLGADLLNGGDGDDKLISDAFDQVYGGLGKDWFDQFDEAIPNTFMRNPRPGRYMDWKII